MRHSFFAILTAVAITLISCDDTTDTIGMSLTQNINNVVDTAYSFPVESHSITGNDIVTKSSKGYLGKFKDPETNSYITCNFMTQVTTMGNYQFDSIDSIYVEDLSTKTPKEEQVKADSCELRVFFSSFYGDTLALMKVMAHELNVPYEEGVNYKTDFDPKRKNMLRTDKGSIHSELSYTISNRVFSDDLRQSSSYTPQICFSLNDEYIDKDGVSYNNFGTYIMRKFYNAQSKGCFTNPYRFSHEIFPGFYIENIGGIGSIGEIFTSEIIIYFPSISNGKKVNSISVLAGTEEVLRKTSISQDLFTLNNMIDDNTCTYLKTPAGIFTELSLPIDSIMLGRDNETETHENDTLNTVRLFVPRINDRKSTGYNLPVPKTLLLLPTDSISNFFENRKVADARTSYITTYASTTNGYTFANISALVSKTYDAVNDTINKVLNEKKMELGVSELQTEEAKQIKREVVNTYMQHHPSWNKVAIIPVETTYSTLSSGSSLLTKVTYDMNLRNTRLIKGLKDSDNITVSVIYSKFKD